MEYENLKMQLKNLNDNQLYEIYKKVHEILNEEQRVYEIDEFLENIYEFRNNLVSFSSNDDYVVIDAGEVESTNTSLEYLILDDLTDLIIENKQQLKDFLVDNNLINEKDFNNQIEI